MTSWLIKQPIFLTVPKDALWVGGKLIEGDAALPPVGVYDEIRMDVRMLSTKQPVEAVGIERTSYGYRGVLVSKGKLWPFTMDDHGMQVASMSAHEGSFLKTWKYLQGLLENEQLATMVFRAKQADLQQDQFNLGDDQPGPASDRTEVMLRLHGPAVEIGASRLPVPIPLMLSKAKKPYGQPAYTRKDPRTGKLVQVKPRGVKPMEDAAPSRQRSGIEDLHAAADKSKFNDYMTSFLQRYPGVPSLPTTLIYTMDPKATMASGTYQASTTGKTRKHYIIGVGDDFFDAQLPAQDDAILRAVGSAIWDATWGLNPDKALHKKARGISGGRPASRPDFNDAVRRWFAFEGVTHASPETDELLRAILPPIKKTRFREVKSYAEPSLIKAHWKTKKLLPSGVRFLTTTNPFDADDETPVSFREVKAGPVYGEEYEEGDLNESVLSFMFDALVDSEHDDLVDFCDEVMAPLAEGVYDREKSLQFVRLCLRVFETKSLVALGSVDLANEVPLNWFELWAAAHDINQNRFLKGKKKTTDAEASIRYQLRRALRRFAHSRDAENIQGIKAGAGALTFDSKLASDGAAGVHYQDGAIRVGDGVLQQLMGLVKRICAGDLAAQWADEATEKRLKRPKHVREKHDYVLDRGKPDLWPLHVGLHEELHGCSPSSMDWGERNTTGKILEETTTETATVAILHKLQSAGSGLFTGNELSKDLVAYRGYLTGVRSAIRAAIYGYNTTDADTAKKELTHAGEVMAKASLMMKHKSSQPFTTDRDALGGFCAATGLSEDQQAQLLSIITTESPKWGF